MKTDSKQTNGISQKRAEFHAWLESSNQPILADGAMGTMLNVRGIGFDQCFDALNLSRRGSDAELRNGAACKTE